MATKALAWLLLQKIRTDFLNNIESFKFFVLLTITILFLRCLFNQILNGRSQIESWDMDRLESLFNSGRLTQKLIDNTWRIYPESRSFQNKKDAEEHLTKKRPRFDELVNFPYDFDLYTNALLYLGPIHLWLWPYGVPKGDGNNFPKNDISKYEANSSLEDHILSLPWPPDGGKTNTVFNHGSSTIEMRNESGEQLIRTRLPQNGRHASREKWYNDWGESLDDFGVDVDME